MHKDIAKEILEMVEHDQAMRAEAMKNQKNWDPSLDRHHTKRMKELIAEIGWPTISKVGADASHGAWLLIQHADHDPTFQATCLVLMKSQPPGDIQPKEIAYLEDRILVANGQPQLYGTQFFSDEQTPFGPRPIADLDLLDVRRDAFGLGSFAEYERHMQELYGSKPAGARKKKPRVRL